MRCVKSKRRLGTTWDPREGKGGSKGDKGGKREGETGWLSLVPHAWNSKWRQDEKNVEGRNPFSKRDFAKPNRLKEP